MALGSLIGAYQEDDSGGLRALLPLAGRTLLEYQVRCAAAAGAAPIVVVVDRVPQALQDAFERLRLDGIGVFPVSDVHEAVSRFEAGSMLLLIGDGVAASAELVAALAEEPEAAVATVPDNADYEAFERIDAQARWAGVAVLNAQTLGSTAAMLGDWDLQSTLLRRAIQEGALRVPVAAGSTEPLIAERPEQLEEFQRGLIAGSRQARTDWASRFVLPPVEEFATEQLMETGIRPGWLIWAGFQPGLDRRRGRSADPVYAAGHDREPFGDIAPPPAARPDAEPRSTLAGRGNRLARTGLLGESPAQRLGSDDGCDCGGGIRTSRPDGGGGGECAR